jgi:serine/threonine-protein kinase HipA
MKELQVRYQGLGEPFLVGTLAEDPKDVLFQYSGEALARGVQLSPIRLPLRQTAYPERQSDYANLHAVPPHLRLSARRVGLSSDAPAHALSRH